MPGRHRRPRRNPAPVLTAAAASALLVPAALTAGTHASAATSRETAMARAAQPSWWHAAHVAHLAHLARSSTAAAPVSGRTWGVSYGYPDYCGDGDGDGWDVDCATRSAPASNPDPAAHPLSVQAPAASSGTYSGGSGFQQCVIARESGGNSQVMNSSGHYGLYQFDYGTWVSGGGSGGSFGHASVTEQNQVFASVYAARGTQPWSPSDGC